MRPGVAVSGVALFCAGLGLVAAGASAQGNALYSRDGVDVYAVGDAGTVYRSVNGGANWFTQTVGTRNLRGVAAQGFYAWIACDLGEVWRSTNDGGSWTQTIIPGTPNLRGVEMASSTRGWIVGFGGTILATTDAGANWVPQISGTSQNLYAVRFRDTSNGWAVGAGGTVLKTTDGGANWSPVSVGTTKTLRSVDYLGSVIWVVGNDATAYRSTDGGTNWTKVNLKIDSKSDATAVWLDLPNTVYLAGGGGFIRKSTNGGTNWTFPQHGLMGEISDLYFTNGATKGWACSSKNRAVIRTANSGSTWSLPTSATMSQSWSQKQSTSQTIRGSSFAQNGQNKNVFYCVMGGLLYKSLNRGDTWSQIGSIPGASKTNALYVNPSDSLLMVAATDGPDRVVRSTNGGSTWTATSTHDFTEYGVPLEMNVDKPNSLLFAPEDGRVYNSDDFGATWTILSTPNFRSPCDIQIVPDSTNIIYVGDGVTGSGSGQIFQSTNSGATFTLKYTTSGSEIPMIAAPRFANGVAFATNWSAGGVERTLNYGGTWSVIQSTGSAWGCAFSQDDANVAMYGVYGGATTYLTLDQGATFLSTTTTNFGSNYGMWSPDRGTFLALQSGGIWKWSAAYTVPTSSAQSITVTSPNGAEAWATGEVHNITWTSSNMALAYLEYRSRPGQPWQPIGNIEGYTGTFAWTVPFDATTLAKVRVSDNWDSSPTDTSNAAFNILTPVLAVVQANLAYGDHDIGTVTTDSVRVRNTGTAPMNVALAVAGSAFRLGRTSFTLAAGASDTVSVTFQPMAAQTYADTIVVTGAPNGSKRVSLSGNGIQSLSLDLAVPDGGESWQYGHVYNVQWASAALQSVGLDYQTSPGGPWITFADSAAAAGSAYAWTIPYAPTNQARVRIRQRGGTLADSSAAVFDLTSPLFAAAPETLDIPPVAFGQTAVTVIDLSNPGTAPLEISNIASDHPEFHPGRTQIVLAPAATDTVGIYYSPATAGPDTASIKFITDDPFSPHKLVLRGQALWPVDVAQALPKTFGVRQNSPNPFTSSTLIHYAIPKRVLVTLDIFDLGGRRVARLVHAEQNPGEYSVSFGPGARTADGHRLRKLSSGVYFCRFTAGDFERTYKMSLTR